MAAAKPSGTEVSRRSLFTAAAAILGGFAASALGWMAPRSAAAATKKIAQKVAQYQDTPKGSQHCALCTHFEPPSSCQLVAGKISPNGWCILFSPKKPA
ncbi:MAG: hypothetical protein ACREFK_00790 [Stellaceae bacterium]